MKGRPENRSRAERRAKSPCPELDGLFDQAEKNARAQRSLGRLGRRARLRAAMVEVYGKVPEPVEVSEGVEFPRTRIPKAVRQAAEGLLDEAGLALWWVSPNGWLWPRNTAGYDISREFVDRDGNTTVTPKLMWSLGLREDVVDLLWALRGDPYELVLAKLED